MGATQRGLARKLGVDQSVLSRFLNQQPGYEPSSARPRAMRVLELIEQFCSHLEDVSVLTDESEFDPTDEIAAWERAINARFRQVRREVDPGFAMSRLPELCAQAFCFPLPHRPYVCVHAELAVSFIMISEERAGICSNELVRQNAARLERLRDLALEDIPGTDRIVDDIGTIRGTHDELTARALNYAGLGLAFAGMRIRENRYTDAGVSDLLRSTDYSHRPIMGIWHNVFLVLERLFAGDHPRAVEWAASAADQARKCRGDNLSIAMNERSIPLLREHWSRTAADVLDL